jgi:hypothetical protein
MARPPKPVEPLDMEALEKESLLRASAKIFAGMDRRPGMKIENCSTFDPLRDWGTPVTGRGRRG